MLSPGKENPFKHDRRAHDNNHSGPNHFQFHSDLGVRGGAWRGKTCCTGWVGVNTGVDNDEGVLTSDGVANDEGAFAWDGVATDEVTSDGVANDEGLSNFHSDRRVWGAFERQACFTGWVGVDTGVDIDEEASSSDGAGNDEGVLIGDGVRDWAWIGDMDTVDRLSANESVRKDDVKALALSEESVNDDDVEDIGVNSSERLDKPGGMEMDDPSGDGVRGSNRVNEVLQFSW